MRNRIIEFRGLYEQKWVYGDLVRNMTLLNDTQEGCAICFHDDFLPVDPQTVGQYLNIKDRNKVKIYEGDIARMYITSSFFNGYLEGPIRSIGSRGACIFKGTFFNYQTKEFTAGPEYKTLSAYRSEIISNIHKPQSNPQPASL